MDSQKILCVHLGTPKKSTRHPNQKQGQVRPVEHNRFSILIILCSPFEITELYLLHLSSDVRISTFNLQTSNAWLFHRRNHRPQAGFTHFIRMGSDRNYLNYFMRLVESIIYIQTQFKNWWSIILQDFQELGSWQWNQGQVSENKINMGDLPAETANTGKYSCVSCTC